MKFRSMTLADDPFKKITDFLDKQVVTGFLNLAIPIAVLSIIGLVLAAYMSHDDHSKAKFKSGLFYVCGVTIVLLLSRVIIGWLKFNIR
ncbi:hypothetical protein ACFQ88_26550 [Paenibacillus sp. NPDC056579]|uniref:hypothetical protein n=1 Tax=unclassified Paenibacillus TaxID=185978 RepID=UPI001EF76CCE|nr:hypothetical protein [Paenibacillus sp. H1-7]ULL18341.1 hypothetical protein DVH26_30080 [Paenibacillus sp. H1-7]